TSPAASRRSHSIARTWPVSPWAATTPRTPKASSISSRFLSPFAPKPKPKAAIRDPAPPLDCHGCGHPTRMSEGSSAGNEREIRRMTERKDSKLWGGRFERAPDARFDAFQRSFAFDRRLLPQEIAEIGRASCRERGKASVRV